jgi:tRNA (mo5U34)-methyltransferase
LAVIVSPKMTSFMLGRPPEPMRVWGAFEMPGSILHELQRLWRERAQQDRYPRTMINACLAGAGRAGATRAGQAHVEVGTLHGDRDALQLLTMGQSGAPAAERGPAPRAGTIVGAG